MMRLLGRDPSDPRGLYREPVTVPGLLQPRGLLDE